MDRILKVVLAREPSWMVEATLEAERQRLIDARQEPDYDEQADIGSRLLIAGTKIMLGN